jgi:hypothetical protein
MRPNNQQKRTKASMKSGNSKKIPNNPKYPEKTDGSRIAESIRVEANNLSEEDRSDLFDLGRRLIYGGPESNESKETARTRH